MRFGMNLLLWTGELHDGMMPVLEMLKRLGYDGVELPIFNTGLDYSEWGRRLDRLAKPQRTAGDVGDRRRDAGSSLVGAVPGALPVGALQRRR